MTVRQKNPGANNSQTMRNIAAICELERRALARRSGAERFSDFVAHHAGRLWFIVLHCVWYGLWILWNTEVLPGARKFDPFPFTALTTVVRAVNGNGSNLRAPGSTSVFQRIHKPYHTQCSTINQRRPA